MEFCNMLAGLDCCREIDAIFINSPLKNYDISPRYNDFTLPVLGLGYIATYANEQGFNVGVLDAESLGLGISKIAQLVNTAKPRWVGLNLLAPTYKYSVEILQALDFNVLIMLGGHQVKAIPQEILHDQKIPRIDALIIGEGEYRVAELLKDVNQRERLPGLFWRDLDGQVNEGMIPAKEDVNYWLAPNIDTLPFINREFLIQDPLTTENGTIEANLVGSRGCPYIAVLSHMRYNLE
jgi:anaerobic magnesium-protoporphyrin IX monomethyl ester cyclase